MDFWRGPQDLQPGSGIRNGQPQGLVQLQYTAAVAGL